MDPELKARLRWLKPGSREYQGVIDQWNREQRDKEEAAFQREQRALEGQAGREARGRAEQEERERRSAMVTAGSTAAGLAGGITSGYLADLYATPKYRKEMGARGARITELANTARGIDPNAPGARGAYADVDAAARRGRLLRRPIPWGTSATALPLAGFGLYSTFERAPQARSDIERGVWTGTGYGELGAAAKLGAGSLHRYFNPGVSYPAGDVAALEGAGRMARGGELGPLPGSQPPGGNSPPPDDAAARRAARQNELMRSNTIPALKDRARTLKLPVSGTKADLVARIAAAEEAGAGAPAARPRGGRMSRASKAFFPLAAGGLAYDAATSGAEAAELSPAERRTRGLVAGGVAAGTTAGIPYALEKAGPALARTAVGRTAMAALPPVSGAMGAFERGQQEAQPGSWFMSGSGYAWPNISLADTRGNALGQAAQPDEFDQAMNDFLTMAQEYQGGGEDMQPGPAMARSAIEMAGMR